MEHGMKATLAAMLLVPALGLGLGAAGIAVAQTTGTTGAAAGAAQSNKADPRSIVERSQSMSNAQRQAVQAGQPAQAPAGAGGSAARPDAARADAMTRSYAPPPAAATSGSPTAMTYIFDALDTNRDGRLSRAEAAHSSNLSKQMRGLDANHDGNLSREEFAGYRRQ